MKTREYFLESLRSLLRFFSLLGQGIYHLARHLFLNYPNPTWAVILTIVTFTAIFKVAQARSERDRYSQQNAALILQLDSMKQAL